MKPILHFLIQLLITAAMTLGAQQKFDVKQFNDVIISPYIEANLVASDKEQVVINSSTEPMDKVNVEVNGKTLRVYLDDAKDITKTEKVETDGYKRKEPIYKGTVLNITIYYKNLDILSVRGDEEIICESTIEQDKFKLKMYGEGDVKLKDIKIREFKATIYGDGELKVLDGATDEQRIVVYGEAEVDLLKVDNKFTKLTAYGEAEFKINASERIKFTAYGEAILRYSGSPDIDKGVTLGESEIYQIK